MPIKRVVIVHGHASSPMKYWFTDLAEFLKEHGFNDVLIPWMPSSRFWPYCPNPRGWEEKLISAIGDEIEQTAIIGHSFGAITAIELADTMPRGRKLGAVVAVSCPIKWVWGLVPSKALSFLFHEPDWTRVRNGTRNMTIIHSDNDWIAPFRNVAYMKDKLGCEALVLHGYGHLCCPALPRETKEHILSTLRLTPVSTDVQSLNTSELMRSLKGANMDVIKVRPFWGQSPETADREFVICNCGGINEVTGMPHGAKGACSCGKPFELIREE